MSDVRFMPPMLATRVRKLPEGRRWEYELKLDGYRLQAIKDRGKVRLYSRRENDFTRRFARIGTSVSKIKATSFILDVEVSQPEVGEIKPRICLAQRGQSATPRRWCSTCDKALITVLAA
jgi:hypothetical protein